MFDGKILILDGGGIRAMIQGLTLKVLPNIKYDLISGTSAGAINACLLASGYSAEDIIEFYTGDCGRRIFKPYKIPITLNPFNKFMHESTYDSANLRKVLLEKLGDRKLKDVSIDLIIPVYDIKTRKTILFTNLNKEHSELYLRDIACASASAPLYFIPHKFNDYICVDGGLAANNPAMVAYSFIVDKYKNPLFISIGTGTFEEPIKFEDMCVSKPISFVTNLIDNFMDSNSDTVELEASNILKDNYFRFQLTLTAGTSSLDNVKKENIGKLIEMTNKAINGEWKETIEKLKKMLTE